MPAGGHLEERGAELPIGGGGRERKFDHVITGN
jgi:hypothetical protein